MSAATVQDLLAWFISPTALRPAAAPSDEAPAYPADATPLTSAQLHGLKELLSPEAWRYLLQPEEEAPTPQLQRELQAHIARVMDLISPDLREEPLTSPRLRARFRWVQYQLLHAPAEQLPAVHYEQGVRAWLTADRQHRYLNQSWAALPPDQQAAYASTTPAPDATDSAGATAPSGLHFVPRTGFLGDLRHPGFGAWLVQELTIRPLPEIDPYLTLTWVLISPDDTRRPGDSRRAFSEADIPYLCDLLDGDWLHLAAGGRPQLVRAREWFAQQGAPGRADEAPVEGQLSPAPDKAAHTLAGLSAKQIALFHIYEGLPVNTARANHVAAQVGFENGTKIYQRYIEFRAEEDRQCVDGKKRPHLIMAIKAVLGLLSEPAKKRAHNDLFALAR